MSLADLQNKQTMVYEPDEVSEYNYYWYSTGKRVCDWGPERS